MFHQSSRVCTVRVEGAGVKEKTQTDLTCKARRSMFGVVLSIGYNTAHHVPSYPICRLDLCRVWRIGISAAQLALVHRHLPGSDFRAALHDAAARDSSAEVDQRRFYSNLDTARSSAAHMDASGAVAGAADSAAVVAQERMVGSAVRMVSRVTPLAAWRNKNRDEADRTGSDFEPTDSQSRKRHKR